MVSVQSLNQNDPSSKPTPESLIRDAIARGDDVFVSGDGLYVATGPDARHVSAELAELRELRRERIGGCVFKRPGSSYWQLKIPVGDGFRYESARTTDKRTAIRLLEHRRTIRALVGSATIEQAFD